MAAFTVENLTFTYPERERAALDNVSLSVDSGEFVVLCGKSGCGKSTLLRHAKTVLTPHGKRSGQIFWQGVNLEQVELREQASKIGYVLQSPDHQIVTDKVWHELAFGLESLGCDTQTIRLRVAEMASFFGIQEWFRRNVVELSGGQKQLLNLASIMAMQPEMLILDEPTSQLDPIAASDFLETVKKINRELGTTILLSEHRLEEVLPMADRVVVMDKGKIIADDAPQRVGSSLYAAQHDMFLAMPSAMRIAAAGGETAEYPLTVRDGRKWLEKHYEAATLQVRELPFIPRKWQGEPAIYLKDVFFRYEKNGVDVLRDLSLSVPQGSFYALVGGNGTGKSTALAVMSGIEKPYRGKVLLKGKKLADYSDSELFTNCLGVLPQNPQSIFVKKTVELDLLEMLPRAKAQAAANAEKVRAIAELVDITPFLQSHPYDLSGGEQQRAALAKVLLLQPTILLLDEPTKGLDSHFKAKLAAILKKLQFAGTTIVMVSHDVEFCAQHADRCGMFFDGSIVTEQEPSEFFAGNSFYTTAANRMSRGLFNRAVTTEEVISLCQQNLRN